MYIYIYILDIYTPNNLDRGFRDRPSWSCQGCSRCSQSAGGSPPDSAPLMDAGPACRCGWPGQGGMGAPEMAVLWFF